MGFRDLYLAAAIGLSACGGQIDLPVQVTTPDLYIKGEDSNGEYVLAESDETGCFLAYTGSTSIKQREVFIYASEDCESLSEFAKIKTNEELEDIVKEGNTSGELIEYANLKANRLDREETQPIRDLYKQIVDRIKEKHLERTIQ